MRHRALLAATLVCLAYFGLADGATWSLGGLAEVPAVEADTLVGGATCPSYKQQTCGLGTTSKKCPNVNVYIGGTKGSGTLSGSKFCGDASSCNGKSFKAVATICGS